MAALARAPASQKVALLADPALPALARPLAIVGQHTYAAIWPFVNRPAQGKPAQLITRELLLVRDDGQFIFASPITLGRSSARQRPPAAEPQPPADCFLPARPPVPADRLWSGLGVQRYLDGRRPDPADVFRSLVLVLNQFVDFTGSLGPPSLMAEFFAAYLLTTWFSPAFPFLGLLWLTGDYGAGKSRLLALLARLAHLGLYLPVPPPPVALRALASLGASLAVDDADFLGPRSQHLPWSASSRQALLLAGRQRGALLPVTLSEPGGPLGARHTRQLDVSGPRLFAAPHPPHPSVARYFIIVPLVRTPLAALAAADPADPAAWPAGLTQADLVDDLWALSLSRLRDLPPHLSLAAQRASSDPPPAPPPSHFSPPRSCLARSSHLGASAAFSDIRPLTSDLSPPATHLPLLGSSLQPWHALIAVASWLTSLGVPGLFDRLLDLARAYHADRPAHQAADLNVLVLRGLFECVSDHYERLMDQSMAAALLEYNRAGGTVDADDDEDDANDDDTASDANDDKSQKAIRRLERASARAEWARTHPDDSASAAPAFPPAFAFTSAQILAAMRRLAADLDPDLPLDSLTPNLVGRLLGQLRLVPHRTATMRVWAITSVSLARLARAYGVPIPSHLAQHFAAPESSTSTSPP